MSTAEKKLLKKELKRKNLLDAINRVEDFLKRYDENRDIHEVKLRLDKLDKLMETFEEIQGEYEEMDDSPQFISTNSVVRAKVEEQYFRVKGGLVSKLPVSVVDPQNSIPMQPIPHVSNMRLPTISLPSFDGDLNDWLTFHDSFISLIHTSAEIPNIQKFQYLRSALKGDALQLIESLTISANNYVVAWESLVNRYSNKYLLKKKHLQAITGQSKIFGKNAGNLRAVVEEFQRHVKILKQLDEPTESWSSLLVQLLCSRVDDQTQRDWEEFVSGGEEPTYTILIEFLTRKIRTLESLSINSEQTVDKKAKFISVDKRQKHISNSRINTYASTDGFHAGCLACKQYHALFQCPVFEKMSLFDRLNLVNEKKICSNCFRNDHFARKCTSKYTCRICRKRHHSLLHPGFESPGTPNTNSSIQSPPISSGQTATVSLNSVGISQAADVLLSTVVVHVLDGNGGLHFARALLDSGSQCNIMSEQLSNKLRLPKTPIDSPIFGVGESQIRAVCSVSTTVKSRFNYFSFPLDCIVLRNLTSHLPSTTTPKTSWKIPNNVDLADPNFNVRQKVDLIIGAEYFYSFLKGGRIELGSPSAVLVETVFGWLVSGKSTSQEENPNITCHISTLESIDHTLQQFWKIESLDSVILSPAQQYCEKFYSDTVTRNVSGRYVVKYPKREGISRMLGNSFGNATRRFLNLERKLERNVDLKLKYHIFLKEFLLLGHMRKLDSNDVDPPTTFYLPHHAVMKESSTTTKLRCVFDASAKTNTGFSLNDTLLVGPVLQDELICLLIRFRKHKIALLADIEKMYRQIDIHPEDRALQRIVWRFDKQEPISKFELTTVTYGLAPSSFLATRTLKQLADDEGHSFPLAARALVEDMYMDDFISGAATATQAKQLRIEMDELTSRGGFPLRKWCSNANQALEGIAPENLATQTIRKFDPEETIKILGISWEPLTDKFRFDFCPQMNKGPITKRNMLSNIARLYDPLGFVAPIVVRAKVMLQQIWTLSLDWDDEVPLELQNSWTRYLEELPFLSNLRIDRHAFFDQNIELHSFADASETAYGACVYGRSIGPNGEVKVSLLAAKSRVAPLQKRSIPRLELCAAYDAAKLHKKVHDALKLNISSSRFWSDSMVVLHWIRSPASNWKTFIANRVAEIQQLSHGSNWYHVPGSSNPADLVSRGVSVDQLLSSDLWTKGPSWLQQGEENWPSQSFSMPDWSDQLLERKLTTLVAQAPPPPSPIITRFSSYHRMVRVIAYCFRFSQLTREKTRPESSSLSVQELERAKFALITIVQHECYDEEIRRLQKGEFVSNKSSLKLLNPFLDPSGIVRVGGRLRNSREPFEKKHPILLPGFHHFSRLLIMSYHRRLVHGGISLTLATIRSEYWPINGRRAVRSVLRTCFRCARVDPQPINQPVGQLPSPRITPGRPFLATGIDYCGPVFIKSPNRRAGPTKGYVALFVCFRTKAVHIELVGNLTTDAFLAALRRFMSRRGYPQHIYSDNATNFCGAKSELNALFKMFHNRADVENIQSSLAAVRIVWHLIPPRAPNFGGLWEAAVKVAKKHLLRQVGSSSLYYEDLVTTLAQIEACMNSRPLCPLSDDPNDFEALTPGHFLIGAPMMTLPDPDYKEVPINRLGRYELIQQRTQHFWNRWTNEYLVELHRYTTTDPKQVTLKVGQIVILRDQLLPPVRWPLARIETLHPGEDGITRVVTIRTAAGNFKRSVAMICPLPFEEEFSSSDDATNFKDKIDE
ncbi:uncharacterized protein LOC129738386 [Uranotaenia lowii]|uniref:uncharacterized protein LOC129738386 n=1 Tax=Uranotaenia lowii TaxID=190385 RepID=UPI00247B0132|nr:uncharacterized protein LOC129738386 [Uranotaenia lowii]